MVFVIVFQRLENIPWDNIKETRVGCCYFLQGNKRYGVIYVLLIGDISEQYYSAQCLKITQNVAFEIFNLAFCTIFCPIKNDLSGNTI